MPSILHDVTRDAGDSIETVSRAVNGEDSVAQQIPDRVRRTIGKRGNVPSVTARRLVQRRTRMLGIVFHNRRWNWLSDFQHGAIERGLEAGHALLALEDARTAIFASNDDMAAGVIAAAWELDRAVPEGVSVVGFDDVPLAAQLRPALTTVRQPTQEIAGRGIDRLAECSEGRGSMGQEILRTKLVVRDSTAAPCS